MVLEDFARFVGSTRPAAALVADDFAKYRHRLTRRGLGGRQGLSPYALTRAITVVRGMFRRAYEDDLIDHPVKYNKSFDKPTATQKRKSRRAAEHDNGKRLFEPAEMIALIKAPPSPLRAMVLMGINGGFGNNDCARLPMSSVNWTDGVIEFDRPKTGIERIVPLWPETIEAVRESLKNRPNPATEGYQDLLFLTPEGTPWVRQYVHHPSGDEMQTVNTMVADILGMRFRTLIRKLGFKRKGLGFYALRHTFRTWADEVKDQHAIHRIMGHVIPGMSGVYVEAISLERLRAVTDQVRQKLFASPAAPALSEPPAVEK